MHLLYLDDSGNANDAGQTFFVLAGVSVFERQGHWLSERLDAIAARFNPADPGSIEFHGSPMLTGARFWRSVPKAERIQAMKDALGVLRNMAEVPVFLDSRNSRLVQLADLIAYSLFQNYERSDPTFLDVIRARFDASGGIVHGLHVVDQAGSMVNDPC